MNDPEPSPINAERQGEKITKTLTKEKGVSSSEKLLLLRY